MCTSTCWAILLRAADFLLLSSELYVAVYLVTKRRARVLRMGRLGHNCRTCTGQIEHLPLYGEDPKDILMVPDERVLYR